MEFINIQRSEGIARVVLCRGKVNALNNQVVAELREALTTLVHDAATHAVVLTGHGKFFSFGFDIPAFLSFSKSAFSDYLTLFTDLYTFMFCYPKPLVAALNGHTIAGGCMLALACDRRIMVSGKAKISLNELSFGSSVFAGSTEMLRFWVGNRNAEDVLYSSSMYTAEEARKIGLIDEVTLEDQLLPKAQETATDLGHKANAAFADMKRLLRNSVAEEMRRNEKRSIGRFVEIWYSSPTWDNLKKIEIY